MRRPLLATLVTLAACNGLDTRDVERKAKQVAEDRVGLVKSVSCPSAKRTKGVKFVCKVRFVDDDAPRDLRFTLIDDDGGFEATFVPRIVGGERVSEVIADGVARDQPELGDPIVDCGNGIVVVPDDGLVCHLTAGDVRRDLRVTVDDAGVVEWNEVP